MVLLPSAKPATTSREVNARSNFTSSGSMDCQQSYFPVKLVSVACGCVSIHVASVSIVQTVAMDASASLQRSVRLYPVTYARRCSHQAAPMAVIAVESAAKKPTDSETGYEDRD